MLSHIFVRPRAHSLEKEKMESGEGLVVSGPSVYQVDSQYHRHMALSREPCMTAAAREGVDLIAPASL